MAEKKFLGVDGVLASAELSADYAQSVKFDTVRVGSLGVYFRAGLKMRFIPYTYLDKVFIRIQEVNARVCCGSACFMYYRLVLVHDGKEYADVLSESEKAMDDALALIHEKAPGLAIGISENQVVEGLR